MNIQKIEGKVVAPQGMRVGIVASRFNSFIVEKLLDGAVDGSPPAGFPVPLKFRWQPRRWLGPINMTP